MREVAPAISQNTLVVFDLDNTVIEAGQTLGSDQFFGYLVEKGKAQGLDDKAAVNCALFNASFIQPFTPSIPVEVDTPRFIRTLQANGISVIALTARPFEWAKGTLSQLYSVGVDFRRSSVTSDAIQDPNFTARFLNGVLFMKSGQDKGVALSNFMARAHHPFKNVVFIDDKLKNVQNVDAAFNAAMNTAVIPHIEFRYGAADARVKAFNPKIADIEWAYFLKYGMILSDLSALNLLRNNGLVQTAPLVCH